MQARLLASVTAATLNLIVIVTLNKVNIQKSRPSWSSKSSWSSRSCGASWWSPALRVHRHLAGQLGDAKNSVGLWAEFHFQDVCFSGEYEHHDDRDDHYDQYDHDSHGNIKMNEFSFQFINFYASLIYIAFFKVRDHQKIFTYIEISTRSFKQGRVFQTPDMFNEQMKKDNLMAADYCDSAGCFFELSIQVGQRWTSNHYTSNSWLL